MKELIKEVDKWKKEAEQLKTKNESLLLINTDSSQLKKEVNSLRSQNLELQKTKTSYLERLSQLEKSHDFYKNAFKEASEQVKKLQIQKEKSVVEKMESFALENERLKVEKEKIRDLYEKKLVRLASSVGSGTPVQDIPMDTDEEEEHSKSISQITAIDLKAKDEIIRLKNQRELFLNTKVYSESDQVIKMIDDKIKELLAKK